jgi:ubiquinone/menaquinone biosynthesis C-methylase UbiE
MRPGMNTSADTRAAEERIDRTVAAYDAAALEYQGAWRQRRPLDAIRKFGALVGREGRILDVACGPALDVRLLRDAGLKVFGGDRSHESMKLAHTLFPKGALARWDYRRLPFADGVFDGIWAPSALHHMPRAQIRPTLAEWRRVQRRGPIFVTFREGSEDLAPVEDPPVGTVFATSISGDQLRALLLAAGYDEVEVEARPDVSGAADVNWLYGWGRLPQ